MRATSVVLFLSILVLSAATHAEVTIDAPQPRASEAQSESAPPQNRRILKIIPAYGVVKDPNTPFHPLTSRDKFVLFLHGAADPYNLLVAGTVAGVEQAFDIFPGYGQGAAGYGKRFGASIADQASNSLFKNFAFPVLLREDPRYFRKARGTFMQRSWYAASRVFVTRRDSGRSTFNFSGALGSLASSGLANTYYPDSDRGPASTFTRVGIAFGTDAALNVFSEFGPDVARKLLPRKPHKP
jgi:hypothetical protein